MKDDMHSEEGSEEIDFNNYYFPLAAAQQMSTNSQKAVTIDDVRKLSNLGIIRKRKVSERMNIYYKPDVDAYKFEDRGVKAGRAQRMRAHDREQQRNGAKKENLMEVFIPDIPLYEHDSVVIPTSDENTSVLSSMMIKKEREK